MQGKRSGIKNKRNPWSLASCPGGARIKAEKCGAEKWSIEQPSCSRRTVVYFSAPHLSASIIRARGRQYGLTGPTWHAAIFYPRSFALRFILESFDSF